MRMLTVMDEYTRECLAIDVKRRLNSEDVLDQLEKKQTQLMRDLSRSKTYRDQVALLETIPQVGWKTAIEILVELRDVRRFRNDVF